MVALPATTALYSQCSGLIYVSNYLLQSKGQYTACSIVDNCGCVVLPFFSLSKDNSFNLIVDSGGELSYRLYRVVLGACRCK